MFKKIGILVCCFFAFLPVIAQDSVIVETLQKSGLAIRNNVGLGTQTQPAIEFPTGTGKVLLKKLDFWVTGISAAGDTTAIATDIYGKGSSWVQGPFMISGNRNHVSASEWKPFISLTAGGIDFHRSHYKDQGYVVPENIQNYPGNFQVQGFPKILAGFADADGDAVYKPEKGDYPFVPGTQQVFTMGSDSSKALFASGNNSALDLSVLWFVDSVWDNKVHTVFYRTTLCNRGNVGFSNIKISATMDLGLGNPNDNLLATDVLHHALIGYNASGGDAIYGTNPPAVALGWLSKEATNTMYFENIAENVKGYPTRKTDYYLLSNSHWKTGKPLSFGSNGLDGNNPTTFVYSNGTDATQNFKDWDETPGNEGKRTGLISTGPWNLAPSGCIAVDGHVTILEEATDSAVITDQLEGVVSTYKNKNYSIDVKSYGIASSSEFEYWPNPIKSGEQLHVNSDKITALKIYQLQTMKLVATMSLDGKQSQMNLLPGLYVVHSNLGPTKNILVVID